MDSTDVTLPQIWTVAAVLAGFQVSAFVWRIKREISMEAKYVTWLTLSDAIVGISFLLLVLGVFIVPLAICISTSTVARLLGTAILVFAAYPFVFAGHYNLYGSWRKKLPRSRATHQEVAAAIASTSLIVGGVLWVWLSYVL